MAEERDEEQQQLVLQPEQQHQVGQQQTEQETEQQQQQHAEEESTGRGGQAGIANGWHLRSHQRRRSFRWRHAEKEKFQKEAEKAKLRMESKKESVVQLRTADMLDMINQVEAKAGLDLLHFGRDEQGWAEWEQERQAEKDRLKEDWQQSRKQLAQQIRQHEWQQQQDHLLPGK